MYCLVCFQYGEGDLLMYKIQAFEFGLMKMYKDAVQSTSPDRNLIHPPVMQTAGTVVIILLFRSFAKHFLQITHQTRNKNNSVAMSGKGPTLALQLPQ